MYKEVKRRSMLQIQTLSVIKALWQFNKTKAHPLLVQSNAQVHLLASITRYNVLALHRVRLHYKWNVEKKTYISSKSYTTHH